MPKGSVLLRTAWLSAFIGLPLAAQVNTLFQDNFATLATRLNTAAWTTELGLPSYVGRTQLNDWVTPGGFGQFVVGADGARMALNTYNPTGQSLYGTHAKTLTSFLPTGSSAVELTVRLQLTSLRRGIVYGMYFYGCATPTSCATQHDELDIELATNLLQPGAPLRVQLNRYANEPLGPGHGGIVNLPPGFDPLAAHDWTIRWALNRIDYLVDGILLGSATTNVPQGRMQANVIAWGPGQEWPAAYHESLQPVFQPAQNETAIALIKSVTVRQVPAYQRLRFVPLPPCRVMETRPEYNSEGRTGTFGPPALIAGETRTLRLADSNVCQIPASAKVYALNVTLIPRAGMVDFATVYPGGELKPDVWTVRSLDGLINANAALIKSGGGTINVHATQPADILIDIAGYFTDAATSEQNIVFYPMTPCRVVETRSQYSSAPAPFGPPSMNEGDVRRIRFPASGCAIPTGATAYSISLTVVPPQPLAFMTVWPSGGTRPNVSSINSFAGRVVTNHVIVPAGANDSIDVFASNRTDFLIDINGYFAPDDGRTGLYYNPVTQARFFDSRTANASCGGPIFENAAARSVPVATCASTPASAQAYHFSATALPSGAPMPFLTVWPTGQPQPNASMLNAFEGQIVTNSAIVPAGSNGSFDVFAYLKTHIALELNGYFGR